MANSTITLKELLTADNLDQLLETVSFEDGLRLLDELVQRVESGSLPLETAIRSYEKGALLIERLRGLLSGAEQKLKVLQKESVRSGKNRDE